MGGPWLLISSLKLEMSAAQEQLSLIIPETTDNSSLQALWLNSSVEISS